MKAALLNLQEVTYCILLPSEACSQYSYLRNYFVLLSWKRVSLMAISTCKITYWCILFLVFVCVWVCERESVCSVPWHCFCTSLVLAYLIIIFPLWTHLLLPCTLPPLNCRVVAGVTLGSGWPGVWFQCCLQLPLVVCCLVLSCQGLRILGRADKEEMAFSTAGWEYDDGSVCVCVCVYTHMHMQCVQSTHPHSRPNSQLLRRCNKHLSLGHSIHLLF